MTEDHRMSSGRGIEKRQILLIIFLGATINSIMIPENISVKGKCNFGYSKSMWFVYIILCIDGNLYTGISNDPDKRLAEHKLGKGGRYTRSHRPLKIIYREKCKNKGEALKREYEIKSWARKKKIKDLKLNRS